MRGNWVPFDFAEGRLSGDFNLLFYLVPALKHWTKLERPSGAGF